MLYNYPIDRVVNTNTMNKEIKMDKKELTAKLYEVQAAEEQLEESWTPPYTAEQWRVMDLLIAGESRILNLLKAL